MSDDVGGVAGVSVPDEAGVCWVIALTTLFTVLVTALVIVWITPGFEEVEVVASTFVATWIDVVASSVEVAVDVPVDVESSSVEVDVVPVIVLIAFDTTSLMVSMMLGDVVAVELVVEDASVVVAVDVASVDVASVVVATSGVVVA